MAKRKIRVGIIFGGKSGEHEVSLRSAQSVMRAIDKDKYEVVPIGIGIDGRWLTSGDPLEALTGGATSMPQLLKSGYAIDETPVTPAAQVDSRRTLIPGTNDAGIPQIDVIFPVLHGPYGEDGTIQGLLEMAGVPYVGAGVMASALAMDKSIMRDVLRSHGLPVVKDLLIKRALWETQADAIRTRIAAEIGYPCFVKPVNLGSSVGVSKARTADEIDAALNLAASYDRKVLVEWAVPDAREIEVSVLGNNEPIASVPGEVIPDREFYDYESKYSDESNSELLIPAPLDAETTARTRQLAIETYLAFDEEIETPPAGEVIFADAAGQVHARRWTFRQSRRSTVTPETRRVLIVSEGLHETASTDVPALIEALAEGITALGSPPLQQAILSATSPRLDF